MIAVGGRQVSKLTVAFSVRCCQLHGRLGVTEGGIVGSIVALPTLRIDLVQTIQPSQPQGNITTATPEPPKHREPRKTSTGARASRWSSVTNPSISQEMTQEDVLGRSPRPQRRSASELTSDAVTRHARHCRCCRLPIGKSTVIGPVWKRHANFRKRLSIAVRGGTAAVLVTVILAGLESDRVGGHRTLVPRSTMPRTPATNGNPRLTCRPGLTPRAGTLLSRNLLKRDLYTAGTDRSPPDTWRLGKSIGSPKATRHKNATRTPQSIPIRSECRQCARRRRFDPFRRRAMRRHRPTHDGSAAELWAALTST